MTPLDDFYGLLALPLTDFGLGNDFSYQGATCHAQDEDGDLVFEVVFADRFGIVLVFPGWFIGEHTPYPVHFGFSGEAVAMIGWMPISREHKLKIIDALSLETETRCMMALAA